MDIVKILVETPLFNSITAVELEQILEKTRHQTKKYKEGEVIIFQNSVCEYFYFLYKGHANASRITPSGKYMIVEELKAPRVLAPAFIFGNNSRFPVTVNAVQECQVLSIPKKDFLFLLQKKSQILQNFIGVISQQVIYLSEKLKLTDMTLKEKIATYILSHCPEGEKLFTLTYTQQKLADLFGVARTSLARTFALMEQEGILSIKNRTITILNRNMLREITK